MAMKEMEEVDEKESRGRSSTPNKSREQSEGRRVEIIDSEKDLEKEREKDLEQKPKKERSKKDSSLSSSASKYGDDHLRRKNSEHQRSSSRSKSRGRESKHVTSTPDTATITIPIPDPYHIQEEMLKHVAEEAEPVHEPTTQPNLQSLEEIRTNLRNLLLCISQVYQNRNNPASDVILDKLKEILQISKNLKLSSSQLPVGDLDEQLRNNIETEITAVITPNIVHFVSTATKLSAENMSLFEEFYSTIITSIKTLVQELRSI